MKRFLANLAQDSTITNYEKALACIAEINDTAAPRDTAVAANAFATLALVDALTDASGTGLADSLWKRLKPGQ